MLFRSASLPRNTRARHKRTELEPFHEELQIFLGIIPDPNDGSRKPMKPKTAYLVLRDKYKLSVSYETFKLYLRESLPRVVRKPACIRLETAPGAEGQIDYCSVGIFTNPRTGERKKTYGFIGKLSYSRQPFIQYGHSQDSNHFVDAHVRMVNFFKGVPQRLIIDNLKSGVIKADIYDPRINTAYRDFAEYYGAFIDPARVATPTDKGKVERTVQQVRELFRYLVEVHPTWTLDEINEAALVWCREEYGMRPHGTTGRPPAVVWQEEELPCLLPLPEQPFEVPAYKYATVHQDRFLSFEHKRYAMPEEYRGMRLLLRKSGQMLRIFGTRHQLLREYAISERKVNWLPGDFPEHQEALMQGTYPQYLLRQAKAIGRPAEKLVRQILLPHAWIRARVARGILSILLEHRNDANLDDVCRQALAFRIHLPRQLKILFEQMKEQQEFEFMFPQSESGKRMTRGVSEYFQ